MDANFSEARNYTILPATAVNPRNVSLEPMTHPPPFMPTVREMRKRYVTRKGNINDVNEKNGKRRIKIYTERKWYGNFLFSLVFMFYLPH